MHRTTLKWWPDALGCGPVGSVVRNGHNNFNSQKGTPKIGQTDKCILKLSHSLCSTLIVDAVRCLPVKRLMPAFLVVELEIGAWHGGGKFQRSDHSPITGYRVGIYLLGVRNVSLEDRRERQCGRLALQ